MRRKKRRKKRKKLSIKISITMGLQGYLKRSRKIKRKLACLKTFYSRKHYSFLLFCLISNKRGIKSGRGTDFLLLRTLRSRQKKMGVYWP